MTKTLAVEMPADLETALAHLAHDRQTTLNDLVLTVLERYLEDQADIRAHEAALAEGGALIPGARLLAELGAELPTSS